MLVMILHDHDAGVMIMNYDDDLSMILNGDGNWSVIVTMNQHDHCWCRWPSTAIYAGWSWLIMIADALTID